MESVYCEIKYSGAAEAFLVLAVGSTLAIVVFVPFPDALRAVLFAWTVAAAWHARTALHRATALKLDASGTIELRQASGAWVRGRTLAGSFVSPWLVIVHWRPEGARARRTLLLLPGMAAGGALRGIRVILRWA